MAWLRLSCFLSFAELVSRFRIDNFFDASFGGFFCGSDIQLHWLDCCVFHLFVSSLEGRFGCHIQSRARGGTLRARKHLFICLRIVEALSNPPFKLVKLLLRDELRKRTDLLLVEKCYEVVGEPSHLAVSGPDQLLFEFPAVLVHHCPVSLKLIEVWLALGARPFSGLLLVNQTQEGSFVLLGLLVGAARKQHRQLVDLEHHVRKIQLDSILRLLHLIRS